MLYHLFEYLKENVDFPGVGLFRYISVRSIMSVIIALMISLIAGKFIIARLKKNQITDTSVKTGDNGKTGTPTMGGIVIIISLLVSVLLLCDLTNLYVQLLIVSTLWLSTIGFLDDLLKLRHKAGKEDTRIVRFLSKLRRKDKDGMKGKLKIYGQVGLGLIVGISLYLSDKTVIVEMKYVPSDAEQTEQVEATGYVRHVKSTKTTIPFLKDNLFDYAWLTPFKGAAGQKAGWVVYVLVAIFIVTAVSNGTNLTDGRDGLATGTVAIAGVTLGVLAYLSGNIVYARYLNIMYIPNSGEMVVFMAGLIGALIGFLWYNTYPAQVFMGDVGSLTLGGIIAVFALMIRVELLLVILCGIFLAESISVLVQRLWYKYTRIRATKKLTEQGKYQPGDVVKGERVWVRAPLHDHYIYDRKKVDTPILLKTPREPIAEPKVVVRFWIISILLAVLTIITLKIR
ncbi:MAG TPA: phospho-N-acetylmuramoyl-pentapeptide-transferase [Bacteroidales bacterium]|nr:phospho-N-acetylmuramoyl-pentapeptide-transferase [Bacteroidales bacterium]HOR12049.1 phospho-N-acetylmuramoyl-pentapeptide-transferase [Bacteroidales bacterium]HOZ19562.1 phospho-N-acetylmuramoyl-pentapeptide-transferase [Bacteroidales bacterium]HPK39233.1 phospho-N-acetylmuramoyl-pentapeptide-transferase [Bacteroidales bacterium]